MSVFGAKLNFLVWALLFHLSCFQFVTHGVVLDKCEVSLHLEDLAIDKSEWDHWICLADKLSQGNTTKVAKDNVFIGGNNSDACRQYSLGIFQISNAWCTTDGHPEFGSCMRNGCKLDCFKLLDDDISDDIKCLKYINNTIEIKDNIWIHNNCRRSRATGIKPIYSECLVDGKVKRHGRALTSIPLWASVLIAGISSIIVFSLTFLYYKFRQKRVNTLSATEVKEFKYGKVIFRQRSSQQRFSAFVHDNYVNKPYDTEFEVGPSKFVIDYNCCLGSGAYGVVYKAVCKERVVAVKTVNPQAGKAYLQSLLGEIKILSHIGRHDFIVNLEGAYTKKLNEGTLYVFMEYCKLGNLEKYLRANRSNFVGKEAPNAIEELADPSKCTEDKCVTLKKLLQYAHQVAQGMEFLSTKQVIHGDLAARNILLVDRNTAKISDFGLSRKLYDYVNYIKKKEEPLPWRWMAIESLREMNFSTASDVWMYGVLLFEIFSLGEVPYPGLSYSLEFVEELEKGFRMLRPKHAPLNIYNDVILRCWERNPTHRPSFSELAHTFYDALDKITSTNYTEIIEIGKRKCTEVSPEVKEVESRYE